MARSDVELIIQAKDEVSNTIDSVLRKIKSLESELKDLGRNQGLVTRFKEATAAAKVLEKQISDLQTKQQRLAALQSRYSTGQKTFKELGRQIAAVKKEITPLNREYQKQINAADRYAQTLAKSGVNVNKLAQAEAKLTKQIASKERIIAIDRENAARAQAAKAGIVDLEKRLRIYKQLKQAVAASATADKGAANKAASEIQKLGAEYQKAGGNVKVWQKFQRDAAKQTKTTRNEVAKLARQYKSAGGSLKDWGNLVRKNGDNMARLYLEVQKYVREVDNANKEQLSAEAAAKAHAEAMDRLQAAYIAAGGSAEEFGRVQTKLKGDIDKVTQAVKDFASQRDTTQRYRDEMAKLAAEFRKAGGSLSDWKKRLGDTRNATARMVLEAGRLTREQQRTARATREFNRVAGELQQKFIAAGGSMERWRTIVRQSRGDIDKLRASTEKYQRAQEIIARKGKTALSFFQRFRSQILGLTAAYVGLEGVNRALQSTFNTQNQLIAARNRFAVGFQGDNEAAVRELEYARNAAEQLKIPIEAVIDDYSKFVAASRDLGYTQNELRKIFIGVSKAVVVNKLSIADTAGVWRALQQIMSKNQVMAEELRQQLGDRLPGAVSLLATALGKSTAELSKMMEQGEISAEALIPFAEQMEKAYGEQLADALDSPRAKLADFQNALFNLRDEIAKSGFIDELTAQLQEIARVIQEPGTQEALINLAKLLGLVLKLLLKMAEHWEFVAAAAGAVLGLKIISFFVDLIRHVKMLTSSMDKLPKPISSVLNLLKKLGPVMTGLVGIFARLAGPAGLILAGVYAFNLLTGSMDTSARSASILAKRLKEVENRQRGVNNAKSQSFELTQKDLDLQALDRQYNMDEFGAAMYTARKEVEDTEKKLKDLQRVRDETAKLKGPGVEPVLKSYEAQIAAEKELLELRKNRVQDLTDDFAEYQNKQRRILNGDVEAERKLEADRAEKERLAKDELNGLLKEINDKKKEQTELSAQTAEARVKLSAEEGAAKRKLVNDAIAQKQGELADLKKQLAEVENNIAANPAQADNFKSKKAALEGQIQTSKYQLDTLTEGLTVFANDTLKMTGEAISDFVSQGSSDISKFVNDAAALGENINEEQIIAKFDSLRKQLRAQLLTADNSAFKETINAALRDLDVAEAQILNRLDKGTGGGGGGGGGTAEDPRLKRQQQLEEAINQSLRDRQYELDKLAYQREIGNASILETERAMQGVDDKAREILLKLAEIARSEGFLELARRAEIAANSMDTTTKAATRFADEINDAFYGGMFDAIEGFIRGTMSARDAFLTFASDFLKKIAEMILQYKILAAIKASGGAGGVGGFLTSLLGFHTGGVVGYGGAAMTRSVPSWIVNMAPRYHNGGIAGLAPNEVPAVLMKGEEILPANDPRHRNNISSNNISSPQNVRIINAFDSAVIGDYLNSSTGERVILNAIRNNPGALRQVLS